MLRTEMNGGGRRLHVGPENQDHPENTSQVARACLSTLCAPKEKSYKKIRTRRRGANNTVFTGIWNHNYPSYTKWVKRFDRCHVLACQSKINRPAYRYRGKPDSGM